jgi:spore coat polysaccharide biosynthesis predicted glycosyltransferase SpsG
VVVVAENQRGIATGLDDAGACVSLGWFEQLTVEKVGHALEGLLSSAAARRRLSERSRELVDGEGVNRTIDSLLAVRESPSLGG